MEHISITIKNIMRMLFARHRCKHTRTENLGEPTFSNKAICLDCGSMCEEGNTDSNKEGRPSKKTSWDYNWEDL